MRNASSYTLFALLVLIGPLLASPPPPTAPLESRGGAQLHPVPVWLRDFMAYLAGGSGRWRTVGEVDAKELDGYEIRWTWGLGRSHVRGQLFPVKEGTEFDPLWEFGMFWDPIDGVVRISQHGSDGTTGSGSLTSREPKVLRAELHLLEPDGTTVHFADEKSLVDESSYTSRSFHRQGDSWQPTADYVWKRLP